MRYIFSLLLLPSLALAQTPAISHTEFANTYLHCDQLAAMKQKNEEDRTCEDIVNIHFCEIYNPLPADVKRSIALELSCNFLAQGMSGKLEQDDADLLKQAGCLNGDNERRKLMQKYNKKNSDEKDALENFTKAYLRNENKCAGGKID